MKPVKLAVLGCGRMGSRHLAAAQAVRQTEVVAVVDPVLSPCASGGGHRIRKLEDVVTDAAIDALLVAAPTNLHEQLVRLALEHHKHVLCEKPLSFDPVADVELGVLARERGCVLQIGFWRRFAEPFRRARALLEQDRIGPATSIRAAQWDATAPPPAFCDPACSGGLEVDCGIHEFDLARWLLRCELEAVAACSPAPSPALGAVGDVDTVHAVARASGKRTLALDLTRTAGGDDSIRTEIIGTRGAIVVEFAVSGWVLVRDGDGQQVEHCRARDVIGDALVKQLKAFAMTIRAGRPDGAAANATDSAAALNAAIALRAARSDSKWRSISTPPGASVRAPMPALQ